MPDTLDSIARELHASLSEEARADFMLSIAHAVHLASVEAILRCSFRLPSGGAEIRKRVFEVERKP